MPSSDKVFSLEERVTATVEKRYPYGLFVRLDDRVRGYIRRREASLSGDIDADTLFQSGERIEAIVIGLPRDGHLYELSHAKALPDPWDRMGVALRAGNAVRATVKNLTARGMYVEIVPGVRGFVPHSELLSLDLGDPSRLFWRGDLVEAVVTGLDVKERLVKLSLRGRLQELAHAEEVLQTMARRSGEEGEGDAPQPAFARVHDGESHKIGRGSTAIVVEDDVAFRSELVAWLANRGFRATGVATIAQARHVALKGVDGAKPALAIVDIQVGDDNGLDMVEELAGADGYTDVVIMSTPEVLEHEAARLESLPIAHVLVKPPEKVELEQIVERLVAGENDSQWKHTVRAAGDGTSAEAATRPARSWQTQLQQLVDTLVSRTRADLGILFHIDPASNLIEITAQSNASNTAASAPQNNALLQQLLESPVEDVITERRSLLESSASQCKTDKYKRLLEFVPFESAIGVPVQTFGATDHALFLFRSRPDAFSRFRLRDTQAAAERCASVLERRMTDEHLQSKAGILLSGQLASMLGHEVSGKVSNLVFTTDNLLYELQMLQDEMPDIMESPAFYEVSSSVRALAASHEDLRSTVALFAHLIQTGETGPVDACEVVEDAVALLYPIARKSGITVVSKLSDDLPIVWANRLRLQQVFVNIMLNAIQQMSMGDHLGNLLEVAAEASEDGESKTVVVRFSDHGPGIHRSRWERIFDLGYSTRTASGGSGLGLYIARNLAESFGGAVAVESSSILLGTTFAVTLRTSHPPEGNDGQ